MAENNVNSESRLSVNKLATKIPIIMNPKVALESYPLSVIQFRKKPPVPPRKKSNCNTITTVMDETRLFVRSPSITSISRENSLTRTRNTVAELAQRFLEENVRNSIKPRIYPMENTSRIKRVPTPFVFTADVSRVRHDKTDGEVYQHSEYQQSRISRGSHLSLKSFNVNLHSSFNAIDGLDVLDASAVFANVGYGNYDRSRSSTTAATTATAFSLMMMGSPAHTRKSANSSQQNDFASLLRKWTAPIPPVLSRKLGRVSDSPLGKVKVMLRICDSGEEMSANGILGVDQRRKQVTLIDPGGTGNCTNGSEERRVGVSAPKMFAFDGIFGEDDDQAEICAASAAELVASVVGGEDGCFVSLGYCTTGKKQTMFGRAVNQKMGVVPTTISWLFKSIQEQKQKTGSRFSVRVSALEVTGGSGHEVINDLLLPFVNDGEQAPSSYLLDSKQEACNGTSGSRGNFPKPQSVLNTVSEVRAPNPVAAGFFLDNAILAMNKEDPVRHIVFTLHVYQYTIDKNGKGVVGGRSRLHCVMLGNGSPSISVLGGLLLAVLNGQRHLPSRESKLGAILRECLGSLTCRAVIMIHVGHRRRCNCAGNPDSKKDDCDNSDAARIGHMSNVRSRYAETLAALQLGSRVHRLRRSRRLKMGSVSSGNGSGGSSGGSGEEMRNGLGNGLVNSSGLEGGETGSSDIDPSSSDLSCDTVIYLGPSIDDATDGEHPPIYLPSLDGTGDDNGIEHKTISKCTHNSVTSNGGGTMPKSKSPKPKPLVNKQSEEQWVDGPKYVSTTPHRTGSIPTTMPPANSCKDGGPPKKSETWIDGPAAGRVSHQANNFPSPKKMNLHHNNNKIRLMDQSSSSSSTISSMKAQMIQQWISNQSQNNGFLDNHHHHHNHPHYSDHSSSPFLHTANDYSTCSKEYEPPHNHISSIVPPYFCYPYSLNSGDNNGLEPEYKSLTVFKTCEHQEEHDEESPSNGYEFEFIEVVEPDVPVPTKDACFQVTEEDIALSFLEENPLPESDQNFSMGVDAYFFSKGSCNGTNAREAGLNNHSTSLSPGSMSMSNKVPVSCGQNFKTLVEELPYDSSISSAASTCTLTERNEDYHPLRVLSQECLTVVSTFADSASLDDEDMDRFWPRFSFPNDLTSHQQQSHPSGMCHGLCKNLVSLSQMSLTNSGCINYDCIGSNSKNESIPNSTSRHGRISSIKSPPPPTFQNHMIKELSSDTTNRNNISSASKVIIPNTRASSDKTTISAPNPPTLSDDSIFKIPANPVFVKIRKMKNEASDTEEEASSMAGGIPPMKLLDLTPIKNNLTEDNGPKSPIPTKPVPNPTNPPARQPPQPGCDHNHHHHYDHPSNNNNNFNSINCNGSTLPRSSTGSSPSSNEISLSQPATSPPPLHIPSPTDVAFTKSPNKSKSRKIAKFFRSSRSKSPKTAVTCLVTSSSESGKSSSGASTISAETVKSSSSNSSSSLGSFPSPSSNSISNICTKSPKHQSPNRRSSATMKNQALLKNLASADYHFTCDNNGTTAVPVFSPNPTTQQNSK